MGYLWLLFSKDHHVAISRIEKMVHKIKTYLKKAEVLVPHYTASEMETVLASIVTTLNTRPLVIFKDEILTPQTFHYHSFQMTPITDSTNLLVKNAEDSIEQQIKTGVSNPKEERLAELTA